MKNLFGFNFFCENSGLLTHAPCVCVCVCIGVNQLLPMGSAHIALPSDVGVRSVSRLAFRQQTFWRQHGGYHGRCQAQFTGSLPGDS